MIKMWSEFNESIRYYISWKTYITRDQFLQQCNTNEKGEIVSSEFEKIEDFLSDFDLDDCDIDYNFCRFKPMYFGVLIKSKTDISGNILDTERLHEFFPKAKLTKYSFNKIGFTFYI